MTWVNAAVGKFGHSQPAGNENTTQQGTQATGEAPELVGGRKE